MCLANYSPSPGGSPAEARLPKSRLLISMPADDRQPGCRQPGCRLSLGQPSRAARQPGAGTTQCVVFSVVFGLWPITPQAPHPNECPLTPQRPRPHLGVVLAARSQRLATLQPLRLERALVAVVEEARALWHVADRVAQLGVAANRQLKLLATMVAVAGMQQRVSWLHVVEQLRALKATERARRWNTGTERKWNPGAAHLTTAGGGG
jgi:hypothetical protein